VSAKSPLTTDSAAACYGYCGSSRQRAITRRFHWLSATKIDPTTVDSRTTNRRRVVAAAFISLRRQDAMLTLPAHY